jgi:hypothetical protein
MKNYTVGSAFAFGTADAWEALVSNVKVAVFQRAVNSSLVGR